MNQVLPVLNDEQTEVRDAFVERLLQSTAGVFDMFTLFIGGRLGLYQALSESGPLTSAELAERTETQERYVREWLEQQTVSGILEVENGEAGACERRFILPAGRAEVLVERESLNYLAPLAQLVAGAVRPIEQLLDAFRHGGGVPYSAYGEDFLQGQSDINRAAFLYELGFDWLPAVKNVNERLQSDPPARGQHAQSRRRKWGRDHRR